MSYYFSKTVGRNFNAAVSKVTEDLMAAGFGVLTEIDMRATLKKKLDVDGRPYKILGACNPPFAHQALMAEANIGLMLPCNVIVRENQEGNIEVAAIDPVASMMAIENKDLVEVAKAVRRKLKSVIEQL